MSPADGQGRNLYLGTVQEVMKEPKGDSEGLLVRSLSRVSLFVTP